MSEAEQTEQKKKEPFDIDKRLKEEIVDYRGLSIKIVKMPSFIGWKTFLDIRRTLGIAYPEFGEQLEKLFRGQSLADEMDEATMISMFFTAITLADSDDIIEIQNRTFMPLQIRLSEQGLYQPFELMVREFYDRVDPLFIGELLIRCLVVNFFESLFDLLHRWETEAN